MKYLLNKNTGGNTGLAKWRFSPAATISDIKVWFSTSIVVAKIATFAKLKTIIEIKGVA
ncbi:hypothetical protein [Pedobacter sp. Leaf216]|uniref:hypothetical protein n=1 Tax=Pedobacter sp. Leaf216 TaxID=1735684 RepID=UPI000A996084|nr:hypothetical protein [Pedobacter sp. Leaf216]